MLAAHIHINENIKIKSKKFKKLLPGVASSAFLSFPCVLVRVVEGGSCWGFFAYFVRQPLSIAECGLLHKSVYPSYAGTMVVSSFRFYFAVPK